MVGYYCPMQRDPDDGGNLPCDRVDCMWYDCDAGICAVLAIARAIRGRS